MTPREATEQLFQAAQSGNLTSAQKALGAGADPKARDRWRRAPLHYAAVDGYIDIARLLIDEGADPKTRDQWQQTPLHWAAKHGHAAIARLLIHKGADLHARDWWEQTPRNLAAANGYTEAAELLATAGRWRDCVTPLLDADQKLDVTQLVDQAGEPTEALKNLLPNDLFSDLARPDFYRQGMDGLVLVFPHLPEAVQASIDLVPWRRAKVQEGHAAAGPEASAVERYSRRPHTPPSSDVTR